jgi:hypothetical protein
MERISTETRTARKDHICDWCGLKIYKGETYRVDALKDGAFYTWKSHPACQNMVNQFDTFNDCEDLSRLEFEDAITEMFHATHPAATTRTKFSVIMEWAKTQLKTE